MNYAIFFDIDNVTYRLPTNPEEVKMEEGQEIEEFDILRLGKIAVPKNMKLATYSFEVEFPHTSIHYSLTNNEFKEPSFYIELFRRLRSEKKPVRVIISNGVKDISELVLIENIAITEKSGEEGDYYIEFELKQFKPYAMNELRVNNDSTVSTNTTQRESLPQKPQGNIHIVQKGDSLWKIAKKYLGDGSRYTEIYKQNKNIIGPNPNIIKVGQKLTIPKG